MPRSNLTVNWPIVDKAMREKGWDLEKLKTAAAVDLNKAAIACARSIDNAKAGRPVIKATIRAIARALGLTPPERIVNGYVQGQEAEKPRQWRVIELSAEVGKKIHALEDLRLLLDDLLRQLKSDDFIDIIEVKDTNANPPESSWSRNPRLYPDDEIFRGIYLLLDLSNSDANSLDEIFMNTGHALLGITRLWNCLYIGSKNYLYFSNPIRYRGTLESPPISTLKTPESPEHQQTEN